MILVDTSVWIDHFRSGNAALVRLLEGGAVLSHPWVIGELALGSGAQLDETIRLLRQIPQAVVAADHEILRLIGQERLGGTGIGYVDAQLLAATRLSAPAKLWTHDQRLATVAARLGLAVG